MSKKRITVDLEERILNAVDRVAADRRQSRNQLIGESIDRMLRQLMLAGKFRDVRGIIFGEMRDCATAGQAYSLPEVIRRVLEDLGIPIAFGLRSGHVSKQNITLPIGVRAKLHVADSVRLSILESSVVAMAPQVAAKS